MIINFIGKRINVGMYNSAIIIHNALNNINILNNRQNRILAIIIYICICMGYNIVQTILHIFYIISNSIK